MADHHLAEYLERIERLAPLVREHAGETERGAQLAPAIVDALHDTGLFRIFLPERLGGGELTLPESLLVYEAMARIDASTGWNLAICSGGPLLGHFASREVFEEIFADPRAVCCGTLNPVTTQVTRCDGGWRFTGRATYVSGSAQATWINVAGLVLRDGSPQFEGGVPVVRSGLFPLAKHCRILDTWKTTGMRGTGSNDCTFEEVFVPDAFTYEWPDPRSSWQRGPFANIPLVTQLGGSLAAVALGAARHAIDTLMELAGVKVPAGTRATMRERPLAQMQLAQAEGWLQAGRAYLFQSAADVWRRGEAALPFDASARAAARLGSVTAAKLAAMATDVVHDAAGMSAVQTTCDLERCWRDVHTITQHVVLSAGRYEVVGRIMLGLDPGAPII